VAEERHWGCLLAALGSAAGPSRPWGVQRLKLNMRIYALGTYLRDHHPNG